MPAMPTAVQAAKVDRYTFVLERPPIDGTDQVYVASGVSNRMQEKGERLLACDTASVPTWYLRCVGLLSNRDVQICLPGK